MGNPLPKTIDIGTIGELLVQLRLLEFGVQAAPPIKDSGNDLIAIKGEVCKYIQVKTTEGDRFNISRLPLIYHILALVKLEKEQDMISLDRSKIFLLKKSNINKKSYNCSELKDSEINTSLINSIWLGKNYS